MFPIANRRGQTVAFGGRLLSGDGPKYLNSGDLPHYKKGETLYAFHLAKNRIRETKTAILCEGYMDVIAYHQCGITNAVAPLGTALTEGQLKLVQGFADTILLSFDGDNAGMNATWRAILLGRRHGFTVKVIQLSGGKDPAEIMLNTGAAALTSSVACAILDSDFLLSKLGSTYAVNTPEGKAQAARAFFPYVDALQSDIQKESCLEQLCHAFHLKPEAVRRDFAHRNDTARQTTGKRQSHPADISMTAELRAVLAVISNLDQFAALREALTERDFEDAAARELFVTLTSCADDGVLSMSALLERCERDDLKQLVGRVVSSGEFAEQNAPPIADSIRHLQRSSLERQRDELTRRIGEIRPVTNDDQERLAVLLKEKMKIDDILNQ
ncbi:MAG: toprim domain-containing protein, partial [Treponema sp.]|nr:toprim domain-containing protein [Treponema sp.]